jgi:hypothetical protein
VHPFVPGTPTFANTAVVTLAPSVELTVVVTVVGVPNVAVDATCPSLVHAVSTIHPTFPVVAVPANLMYKLVPVQYVGVAIVALAYCGSVAPALNARYAAVLLAGNRHPACGCWLSYRVTPDAYAVPPSHTAAGEYLMSVAGGAVIVQVAPNPHTTPFTVVPLFARFAFGIPVGSCATVAVPVTPENGTLVAAIVPVPLADNEAPVPTTIAAVVLLPLVNEENAEDPTVIVQLAPSAQLCPLTVVALLARFAFGIPVGSCATVAVPLRNEKLMAANAVFGIELAATASVGVVAALVTVGVNHAGHVPAAKLVTVPEPPPPPPAGTTQLPSSRRYRVAPAVAPGSGTTPAAWLVPLGPNTGSRAALTVPLVIAAPLTPPVMVVAFSVPTLIVPAVKLVGERLYCAPPSRHVAVLLCGA